MDVKLRYQLLLAKRALGDGDWFNVDRLASEILTIKPSCTEAIFFKALAAGSQARHEEAEHWLRQALSLDSKNPLVLMNLAKSLSEQGKELEALDFHTKALKLAANSDVAWFNFGRSLMNTGDIDEAIRAFNKSISINKRLVIAHSSRAECFRRKGQLVDAARAYEETLAIAPEEASIWNTYGAVLMELKSLEMAIKAFESATNIQNNYAEAWYNLGNALYEQGRYSDSIVSYDRSINYNPKLSEAWNNRGLAYAKINRHEVADQSYQEAIHKRPNYIEAWNNRGLLLDEMGLFEKARFCYQSAIHIDPLFTEAHHNLAILDLRNENFLEGFERYLNRWNLDDFKKSEFNTSLPRLNKDSKFKNILLWAEQGIGDQVFYAGMLQDALKRFNNITLLIDKRLHPIILRSFERLQVIDPSNTPLDCMGLIEAHAPIGDLGHILSVGSEAIHRSPKGFLKADTNRTIEIKTLPSFRSNKVKCGISWRSFNREIGLQKSIPLIAMAPILRHPDVEFFNLQYGSIDAEISLIRERFGLNLNRIGDIDLFNDLDSCLSAIDACDIVISASNVTAHLAGALGKVGCVMVPQNTGKLWYWHLNQRSSIWYPSLRLFYNNDPTDWAETIRAVKAWFEDAISIKVR